MSLVTLSGPDVEPLTLAEAKQHLRVDDYPGNVAEHPENALIEALLTASRRHAEEFCRRAFIETRFRFSQDAFPCASWSRGCPDFLSTPIRLPVGRLMEVEKIEYLATDGTLTELDSSLYAVDSDSEPARIVPAYGTCWPCTRAMPNAVRVTFAAGYGADADAVPQDVVAAIKLILGDLYEHRQDTLVGATGMPIPNGAERLLWPHRLWPE